MTDDYTFRVLSTGSRTGISALVIDACFVLRAFGAACTFRTTSRRCTDIPWLTGTHRVTIKCSAIAKWSTRLGFTWIGWYFWCVYYYQDTTIQCVSCIAWKTSARRCMICYSAESVFAASFNTWIDTFVVHTSFAAITVGICDAFWSAACVRISEVFRHAGTRSGTISFIANSVRTAR